LGGKGKKEGRTNETPLERRGKDWELAHIWGGFLLEKNQG